MPRPLSPSEYRLLVENSPVMIWRAGLDASCDYFNATWLEFTGRPLEDEVGSGWAQGVHPDDFQRCVAFYLDHFGRREPFEMEYRLRRHDGVYRWIFDRGTPCFDDAGAFAGYIGSCIDVDDRRRAQADRERRDEERLQLAHDFEKWIVAIVSHDIRNPLGAIHLAAHHLLHVASDPIAVRKDAERVNRGVDRIQHIVADLLDVSRERQGGGIPIKPRQADLAAMCRQVIEELEAVAKERAIVLEGQIDGAGSWDEHRIVQAISNLIANALQHGTPGAPVRVRLDGDGDRVTVEIHNEGVIPSELVPTIFDPFRSGGDHRGRGQGLGLGLFIAKAIARAHDGAIEVDSAPDRGTSFRLVLPRRPAPPGQSPPPAA